MSDQKTQRVLLPSAIRNASTACVRQLDSEQKFVRLYLNITVASGTGGLKCIIRGYDRISGAAAAITTGGVAVIATGLYIYEMGITTSGAAGAVLEGVTRILPVQWDVQVVHADGSNYTYSLSGEVFP